MQHVEHEITRTMKKPPRPSPPPPSKPGGGDGVGYSLYIFRAIWSCCLTAQYVAQQSL
jgi:hypothetical protein